MQYSAKSFAEILAAILLILLWVSVAATATWSLRGRERRRPLVTLIFCALTALFLALQLRWPAMLGVFQRDASKIAHGQWWRLLTALLFQDGWLAGGLTNISALLLIGGLAEQRLRRREWISIYCVGALIAEGVGVFWQPVGAGNSVATCSLAGCLIVAKPPGAPTWPSSALRIIAAGSAVLLAMMRDIHGAAAISGMALGAGLPGASRRAAAR